MSNKVALITGASRGIGRAIALELANRGCDVIINYNTSKGSAEELALEIQNKYKVKALVCQADISKQEDVERLVKESINQFKKVDILVNNAGIALDMELIDRTIGHFEKTFKTNVFSAFYLSKLIGDHMVENKYGKIVNISSNNSINCFYPTSIDYDASKAALNNLTKNFAIALSPYVNVNAVAPGWIETDMNKELTPDIMELEKERILKKRIGKPEDVAKLVAFLASDDADYITGEIITIDGGMF